MAGAAFSDKWELPVLKKVDFKPKKAIPFDKALKSDDYDQWVHFYIHDYLFERIWNNPKQYLNRLRNFQGVITPDFSLYWDIPLVMQLWNTYRNRSIGVWLQQNGISIIPNVRWGDERTYEFCFESIEEGGTVAISTYGCIRREENREYFEQGQRLIQPEEMLVYNFHVEEFGTYYVSELKVLVHNTSRKGKVFRGGKKKDRDQWYGKNDKQFQKWWEREGKKQWGGGDIEDEKMAQEVYDEWIEQGRPNVDGGKWR